MQLPSPEKLFNEWLAIYNNPNSKEILAKKYGVSEAVMDNNIEFAEAWVDAQQN